jgi:hypothetical protein
VLGVDGRGREGTYVLSGPERALGTGPKTPMKSDSGTWRC